MGRKKIKFFARLCDVFAYAFGIGAFYSLALLFYGGDGMLAFLDCLLCCLLCPVLFLIEEELKERIKDEEPGISDRWNY